MNSQFDDETSGKSRNQLLTPEQFDESVKLFTDELEFNLNLINGTVNASNGNQVDPVNGDQVINGKCNSLTNSIENVKQQPIKSYNLYIKSLEKSINFRNRGNELFNSKKYSDAIVLYNLVSKLNFIFNSI